MEVVLQQFNQGDERAFKVLFEHFFSSSCVFVKRYIPENEAVEDVVQETFIRIWEKLGVYTDMVYFKAYLYKALRNNALFYIRQHQIVEGIDSSLENESDGVLSAIIEEEIHRVIIEAIDKLPKERLRIVELSMSGCSYHPVKMPFTITGECHGLWSRT